HPLEARSSLGVARSKTFQPAFCVESEVVERAHGNLPSDRPDRSRDGCAWCPLRSGRKKVRVVRRTGWVGGESPLPRTGGAPERAGSSVGAPRLQVNAADAPTLRECPPIDSHFVTRTALFTGDRGFARAHLDSASTIARRRDDTLTFMSVRFDAARSVSTQEDRTTRASMRLARHAGTAQAAAATDASRPLT